MGAGHSRITLFHIMFETEGCQLEIRLVKAKISDTKDLQINCTLPPYLCPGAGEIKEAVQELTAGPIQQGI